MALTAHLSILLVIIHNHKLVHNRVRPEIYENPLIKCTITGLVGILNSIHPVHKSYKLIKLLRYSLTIMTFSQVTLN